MSLSEQRRLLLAINDGLTALQRVRERMLAVVDRDAAFTMSNAVINQSSGDEVEIFLTKLVSSIWLETQRFNEMSTLMTERSRLLVAIKRAHDKLGEMNGADVDDFASEVTKRPCSRIAEILSELEEEPKSSCSVEGCPRVAAFTFKDEPVCIRCHSVLSGSD